MSEGNDHLRHENKTAQDRFPTGDRERVQEWQRRIAWAQKHKPRHAGDWASYLIRRPSKAAD